MRQKRVAAIHDISGIGKCSLTVALPIISAAGIECSVLPTALLSTHTGGFKNIYIKDLTGSIMPIANHWKEEGFEFDAIYSGYLGSMEQVDLIKDCISVLKNEKTLVVVDPVMGDNGKLYQTFSPEFPYKMRELCALADIITPNITEACLMLSKKYQAPPYTKKYIEELLVELSEICKGTIVLTGVCLSNNQQGAAAYNSADGEIRFISCPRMAGLYHGTGDVFASTFVSGMVLGKGMEKSLKAAVEFTHLSIKNTAPNLPELWYGVNFEGVLPKLLQLLEE